MPLWLTALVRLAVEFLARWAKDARRDEDLKEAGRAEQRAEDNGQKAAAERRAASVPEKSVEQVTDDLEKGVF